MKITAEIVKRYPINLAYREKLVVLVDESRAQWAYLDEENEPGKTYNSPAEVKAAIDRKLDAVVKKKFERFKFYSASCPTAVYEATSIKWEVYNSPEVRATVVVEEKGGQIYGCDRLGEKKRFTLGGSYGDKLFFLDGNEAQRAALIAKDEEIKRLQLERTKLPGGNRMTTAFFEKRGDKDE